MSTGRLSSADRKPRRPSGDPTAIPPDMRLSTYAWALVVVGVVGAVFFVIVGNSDPWWFGADEELAEWIGSVRTSWAADVADAVEWLGSPWSLRIGLWGGVAVLLAYRRWRQLFTLATVVVAVEWLTERASEAIARSRPEGALEAIDGYSHPSIALAGLGVVLVGLGYALISRGRFRHMWFAASAITMVVAGLARLYLSVSHLSDLVLGALGGAAIAVGAFALFVPDESFPIDYHRRRSAHLPVTGKRGLVLREALEQQLLATNGMESVTMRHALTTQLGCDVVHCQLIDLKPFGQAGSAGSTPLRISVQGQIQGDVFAKLYSMNHLRSDRWYKLGRAILYGRLEDERPFTSVRRLVEYEDYMLRVMRDAGLPSPVPHGVVQLVPGREYLIVTEFFEGSVEIDQAEVGPEIIDEGLDIVRRLWHAGLAHRDLKPANLLVQRGSVKLIDVAFGEIRPTPWRKSVDLANMMLILALHVGPELVYERALTRFAEQEIAEAFAATRGLTIPSQLKSHLKAHQASEGLDLIEAFRKLAPERSPISIQRWGLRRLGLSAAVAFGGIVMIVVTFQNLRGVGLL